MSSSIQGKYYSAFNQYYNQAKSRGEFEITGNTPEERLKSGRKVQKAYWEAHGRAIGDAFKNPEVGPVKPILSAGNTGGLTKIQRPQLDVQTTASADRVSLSTSSTAGNSLITERTQQPAIDGTNLHTNDLTMTNARQPAVYGKKVGINTSAVGGRLNLLI
ncbi:MAG: hypothetical protein GY710_23415 [Desulfobacteraceae bacterium]|nr:hypothetical protein [Desulfobacteraceae bacterium]